MHQTGHVGVVAIEGKLGGLTPDLHLTADVQIDGIAREVVGAHGEGNFLRAILGEIGVPGLMKTHGPFRQHGGASGQFAEPVDHGNHGVVRTAAKEKIIELVIARLKRPRVIRTIEVEYRAGGVVKKETVGEGGMIGVGPAHPIDHRKGGVFRGATLAKLVGVLRPKLNRSPAAVQRTGGISQTEKRFVGRAFLHGAHFESGREVGNRRRFAGPTHLLVRQGVGDLLIRVIVFDLAVAQQIVAGRVEKMNLKTIAQDNANVEDIGFNQEVGCCRGNSVAKRRPVGVRPVDGDFLALVQTGEMEADAHQIRGKRNHFHHPGG